MANNRKSLSRRKNGKLVSTSPTFEQIIYSEPTRILVEKYLSPKGERLLAENKISKELAWFKYGKNRYKPNPNAVPVKTITHYA